MRKKSSMLRFTVACLAASGLTSCASAGGQLGTGASQTADASERAGAVPPVYALLGEREAIRLTSMQIAALDSVAIWLDSTNRPLVEELFDHGIRRDDDPIRREGDPPRVDREGHPLLAEIGANNEAAEAAIQGLLTEEQRGTVCTVFSRARKERPNTVPRSTARLGVAPGFGAPDVVNYTWPWCVEPSAEEEASTEASSV